MVKPFLLCRVGPKMKCLINEIKAEYLKKNKDAPSTKKITEKIAEEIKKERLLYEKFIPFR